MNCKNQMFMVDPDSLMKDLDHLSDSAGVAYMYFLRHYYGEEKPLPKDLKKLAIIAGLEERPNASEIVSEAIALFVPTPTGYRPARPSTRFHNPESDDRPEMAEGGTE